MTGETSMPAETKSRNFWPYGIIAVFAVFIPATIGLIVMACSHKEELVSANYYEQEIKFQAQMERLARTQKLGPQAGVAYDAAAHSLSISLPTDHVRREATGRIELYRASAAGLDRQVKLQPDANGLQTLDTSELAPGAWKVRVSWKVGNEDFLIEQKVVLNARKS